MSLPEGAIKKNINSYELIKTPFVIFQADKNDFDKMSQKAVSNIGTESVISKVFYSPENIKLIQKQIIKRVFKLTKGSYVIDKQNKEDLLIVMKSVYMQNAGGLNTKITSIKQIRNIIADLNTNVINEVIPGIMTEVKSYVRYVNDVFNPVMPLDRPVNVSNSGTKSLPSVSTLYSNS
ncbi:hypothetical protein QJ850_gp558 [Acanthamoeba polyphaga mimivirus]|uniref:Minor capsid protein P8 central region domain-containing protein n=1 Tax=Acanthamoeba polyphaga mimivirus Kroon TaxID=3069720 RepID=A0A0G2YAM4_9VIRU|nr:hypothetical protein QJ850_gp558 [Acanthamoeba polyphaga mimivirus]AKI80141.1 hypothetical protein [Acanthamoeba polyphaga mimivirus Kroon]